MMKIRASREVKRNGNDFINDPLGRLRCIQMSGGCTVLRSFVRVSTCASRGRELGAGEAATEKAALAACLLLSVATFHT
ncbi:hypothetical protein Droror1_Dr00016429 [Drosera rotundifolia]